MLLEKLMNEVRDNANKLYNERTKKDEKKIKKNGAEKNGRKRKNN